MTAARAIEVLEQEKMDMLKTKTPYNPDAKEKIEAYNMAIKELYMVREKEQASFVQRDRVLKIIDSYKYDLCWSTSEKLWNENLDKIKTKVLKLKEAGQE